jgi:hypothetical protein
LTNQCLGRNSARFLEAASEDAVIASKGRFSEHDGTNLMIDGAASLAEIGFELRSGLAGLGGRPKRHPAWDEGASAAGESKSSSPAKQPLDETSPFNSRTMGPRA